MGTEPDYKPTFFKILIGDFASKLLIPPDFVKKQKGKLPIRPLLKSGGCGRSWHVKLQQLDHHSFCFVGDDWPEFVDYHNLQVGEFLFFHLIDESTFQVTIFDHSCCEKELPEINSHDTSNVIKPPKSEISDDDDDHDDDDQPEECGSYKKESTCFVFVFKHTTSKNVIVPLRFLRESGITRQKGLVLKDPKGRSWAAKLREDASSSRYRKYYLRGGWADLVRVNSITEGDTCVFKFVRSEGINVIQVKVLKKPAAAAAAAAARGRGRPPTSSYLIP